MPIGTSELDTELPRGALQGFQIICSKFCKLYQAGVRAARLTALRAFVGAVELESWKATTNRTPVQIICGDHHQPEWIGHRKA